MPEKEMEVDVSKDLVFVSQPELLATKKYNFPSSPVLFSHLCACAGGQRRAVRGRDTPPPIPGQVLAPLRGAQAHHALVERISKPDLRESGEGAPGKVGGVVYCRHAPLHLLYTQLQVVVQLPQVSETFSSNKVWVSV